MTTRDQLQSALTSRVLIEQAKGYAAAQSGSDPETAFLALRRHARNNNMRLADVAQSVVDGQLEIDVPLQACCLTARPLTGRGRTVVRRS